jgi:hypothetical protein
MKPEEKYLYELFYSLKEHIPEKQPYRPIYPVLYYYSKNNKVYIKFNIFDKKFYYDLDLLSALIEKYNINLFEVDNIIKNTIKKYNFFLDFEDFDEYQYSQF